LDDATRSLRETLNLILASTALNYKQVGNSIIIVKQAKPKPERPSSEYDSSAPGRSCHGQDYEENGKPLAGVTVLEKGTTNGTQTDANGTYTLNTSSKNAVLEISFVGYSDLEINLNGRSVINVQLKQGTKELDQVVVVGYGTQRRKAVTGAVAKVDLSTTRNSPATNISQALRGTVAGVVFRDNGRPGQGGSILIRGQRSITAGNDPLLVLDGIIYNGGLGDINPNDIESMEVLKDASASAIYGTRGSNGVILLTTKRGKTEKPTVTFNTYYGLQSYSHKVKMSSPEQYIQGLLDYAREGLPAGSPPVDPAKAIDYLEPGERANFRAGNTIDPYDVFTQDAPIQSYELGISGRTNRVNYFFSGGLTKEKGLVVNDKSDRVSFRTNLETNVTDWFKAGINAQFTQRDNSGVEADRSLGLSPYAELYFDAEKTQLRRYPLVITAVGNPLWNATRQTNLDKNFNLFSNIYGVVDIPFVKGLSYRLNFSPNMRWNKNYFFDPVYFGENRRDTGEARRFNSQSIDYLLENIVNYKKLIATDHSFDLTLLYSRNKSTYDATSVNALGFANDALGYNNLALARRSDPPVVDAVEQNGISSMARLNYGFKDKYFATFTIRRDGSSVFGPNNKFAVFPSGSLAWVVSDEAFMENSNVINYLKLRVSYGKVGNQAIAPYSTIPRFSNTYANGRPVQYIFGDGAPVSRGLFPSNTVNRNLKWETSTKLNLAVDFEILKGRIGGSVDVYDEDTDDLILNKTISSISGFDRLLTNIGSTNNRGIEVTLNTVNVNSGQFRWSSNLSFSTNKNKIVSLGNPDVDKNGIEDNDIASGWFIGKPIQSFYDFVFDGIYQQGDPRRPAPPNQRLTPGDVVLRNLNTDTVITAAGDQMIIGQLQPKQVWGLTNNFSYGDFSLNFTVTAMLGWIAPHAGFDPKISYSGGTTSTVLEDNGYWTPENRSSTRPRLRYPNTLSHSFYESRDFLRLQSASLGYELKNVLSSMNINVPAARFYVSGRNLITFTKWPGWDPENVQIGYESQREKYQSYNNNFPMARSIVVGLNLSF
jgi:TonB-linked SusC/RagA family outer membrane protein